MNNTHTVSTSSTRNTNGQPPIWSLTEDVLWRIFMINTDNPYILTPYQHNVKGITPRPLEITRASSQVCREWRGLILSSTAIWGRLIDFVSFDQKSDYWRNEVISRCGKASLLWVVEGEITAYTGAPRNSELRSFLLRFLSDHWGRIERIFVNCWIGEDWSVSCRPAPNLKAFEIHSQLDNSSSTHNSAIIGPIFAGHAPRLENFQSTGAHCSLSIDWMVSLRKLSLGDGFHNQEVYEVLQHLPRLESLDLYGHAVVADYQPPIIHLPHLRTMNLDTCLEYVCNIIPAPGCSFKFREGRDRLISKLSHESAISQIYQSYIDLHRPTSISLMCTNRRFLLHNGSFGSHSDPADEDQALEINFTSQRGIPMDSIESYFETFNSPLLSQVTVMNLKIFGNRARLQAAFNKFASSFTSLECLWVDEGNLRILLDCAEGTTSSVIFPSLKVLKITQLSNDVDDEAPPIGYLERFLALRRTLGVPIKTLDLTHHMLSVSRSLDSLGGHVGMKVILRKGGVIVEYECGGGRSEVLKFGSL